MIPVISINLLDMVDLANLMDLIDLVNLGILMILVNLVILLLVIVVDMMSLVITSLLSFRLRDTSTPILKQLMESIMQILLTPILLFQEVVLQQD